VGFSLRKFLAGFDVRAPELDALGVVQRPLADHLGHEEIGQVLDLVRRQGGGRIEHVQLPRLEVGGLEAEAAAVAIGEFVEGRHAGPGPPAFDGLDQGLPVERASAQVGAVRHLAVHLVAVARPAVAGLTMGLLVEQPHAGGDVRRIGALRLRQRRAGQHAGQHQQNADRK
jgi:hypothetical protein